MGKYEAILKVADYGNLTRAAQELGYTQSNLSYMINRLETEFDVKVFHRERQGVTLTKAGQALIPVMRQIEALENALAQTALSHKTGTLRIGSFSSVSTLWLPSILKTFYQKYPTTIVSVEDMNTYPVIDSAVRNGDADCAFYAGTYHSGLDFFPLYRDPYYAVVSENHPLAEQEVTNVKELSQYPFVMPSEGTGNSAIRELVKELHISPTLVIKSQGDLTTLKLVEQDLGISVLPGLSVESVPQSVRVIPLQEKLSRDVGILCKPYGEISDVTKAFLRIARTYTAERKSS